MRPGAHCGGVVETGLRVERLWDQLQMHATLGEGGSFVVVLRRHRGDEPSIPQQIAVRLAPTCMYCMPDLL